MYILYTFTRTYYIHIDLCGPPTSGTQQRKAQESLSQTTLQGLHAGITFIGKRWVWVTPVAGPIFGPLSRSFFHERVFMNEIQSSACLEMQVTLCCVCAVDSSPLFLSLFLWWFHSVSLSLFVCLCLFFPGVVVRVLWTDYLIRGPILGTYSDWGF